MTGTRLLGVYALGQHTIASVIDGEGDVHVAQPKIGCVQHGTHRWHSVEELNVTMGIPGERRNSVSAPDAEPCKDLRCTEHTQITRTPIVAKSGHVHALGNNFGIAMRACGVS